MVRSRLIHLGTMAGKTCAPGFVWALLLVYAATVAVFMQVHTAQRQHFLDLADSKEEV